MKNYIFKTSILYWCLPILLIFEACSNDLDHSLNDNTQNNTQLSDNFIASIIPDGYNAIALDDALETTKPFTDKDIVVVLESVSDESIKDYLNNLVIEDGIPVLVKGEGTVNSLPGVVGPIVEHETLALVYNHKNQGITVELFDEKPYKTTTTKYNKPLSLSEFHMTLKEREDVEALVMEQYPNLSLDSLWADYEERVENIINESIKSNQGLPYEEVISDENVAISLKDQTMGIQKVFSESLNFNRYAKTRTGKTARSTDTDYSSHRIRTYNKYVSQSKIQYAHSEYATFSFDYKVKTRVMVGKKEFEQEEKIFIQTELIPNPGFTFATVRGGWTGGLCGSRQKMAGILHEFKAEHVVGLDLDEDENKWQYDAFGPSETESGSGSYSSSTSFGIKLKPLKPEEILELSFNVTSSYTYSMPDFSYVRNYASEFDGSNKYLTWKWTPGNVTYGAYNNGAGLVKPWRWFNEDHFAPEHLIPTPMKQTNANKAYVINYRAYDDNSKAKYFWTNFSITAKSARILAKGVPFVYCLYGSTTTELQTVDDIYGYAGFNFPTGVDGLWP